MAKAIAKTGVYESLPCGIHLVVIKKVQFARDLKNEIKEEVDTETGEIYRCIEITFQCSTSKKIITQEIWQKPNTIWVLDKILDAASAGKQVHVKDLIGKKIYILVGVIEYHKRISKTETELVRSSLRIFDYFLGKNENRPAVQGDPERNNGIPSGSFIKKIYV